MASQARSVVPRRDARLAALAHAAGLLGITGVGWAIAVAVSLVLVFVGQEHRSRHLVVHAAQATLYQLAILIIDLVYAFWLVVGILLFMGDIPGLPTLGLLETNETVGLTWSAVWGLSMLAAPFWHAWTLWLAVKAARSAWQVEPYWYPIVGARVRDLGAPRTPKVRQTMSPAVPDWIAGDSAQAMPPDNADVTDASAGAGSGDDGDEESVIGLPGTTTRAASVQRPGTGNGAEPKL